MTSVSFLSCRLDSKEGSWNTYNVTTSVAEEVGQGGWGIPAEEVGQEGWGIPLPAGNTASAAEYVVDQEGWGIPAISIHIIIYCIV